jgi:hypothetical protein
MNSMKSLISKFAGLLSIIIVSQSLLLGLNPVEAASKSVITPLVEDTQTDAQTTSDNIGSGNLSNNWAGYASTGGTYTSVSGTWDVPASTNPGTRIGSDAAWIGIGGLESKDLIQAGTLAFTNARGQASYHAWIEMLPDAPIELPIDINPGDSVSASITETSKDIWHVVLKNNTTGKEASHDLNYSSSHSSAEWVVEAPSDAASNSLIPLNQFAPIQFTSGTTVKDGRQMTISESGAHSITMVNDGNRALAVPQAVGTTGSDFKIARTNAPLTERVAVNPVIITNPGTTSADQYDVGGGITIIVTPQGIIIQNSNSAAQNTSNQTAYQTHYRTHHRARALSI